MKRSLLRVATHSALTLTVVALGACGGGGGGSEAAAPFALSSSVADCVIEVAKTCADVQLDAKDLRVESVQNTRPGWVERPANGGASVIEHLYRDRQADGRWRLSLGFVADLDPGIYSGVVEVTATAILLEGEKTSPISYRLEVKPAAPGKLSPLRPLAGVPDWLGSGGQAGRNTYLPVSLDAANFERRWTRVNAASTANPGLSDYPEMRPPAVVGGVVYLPGGRLDGLAHSVWALSEHDGSRQWSQALPGVPQVLLPRGKQVLALSYTPGSDLSVNSTVSWLDRSNGATGSSVQLAKLVASPSGMLLSGDTLLLSQDGNSGLGALSADDGRRRWSALADDGKNQPLFSYARWGAALDDQLAYTNVGGNLRAHRLADGKLEFALTVPSRGGSVLNSSMLNQYPVLVPGAQLLLLSHRNAVDGKDVDNQLSMVDLKSRTLKWTVPGRFLSLPVANGDTVFIANQATRQLEARSLATGELRWVWQMEAGDAWWRGDLILTDSHLFASTDKQTLALDLRKREVAWRYPLGGGLSVSANGVLYVLNTPEASGRSVLTAINLH